MSDAWVGVAMVLVAGVLNGSFAAPTKYATRWKWENIWTVWAVVALFLAPWLLALATVPDLFGFYRDTSPGSLMLLLGFGAGFGLASVLFGLALAAVGFSLGFAITLGLSTAVGSLVPLAVLERHAIFTRRGVLILGGVALILLGVIVSAVAGRMKEREMQASAQGQIEGSPGAKRFKTGLIISILAGLGSPLINFGLAFGGPILSRAAQRGMSPASQANVLWAPMLTAALVPYLAYCLLLFRRNRTWHLFTLPGTAFHWVLGILMGCLWMGSVALYGAASTRMAGMGSILGWPLFMSVIIITAGVWGFATGEWRGVGRRPLTLVLSGMFFLILGFCTVAFGSGLR